MLQIYKKSNKSTITVDPELVYGSGYDFSDHWVHMANPTDKEIEFIAGATGVAEDMIKAALDEEERARVERDDDTGATLVVTDIPFTEEDENHYTYTTLPFGFIMTANTMITVCLEDTSLLDDMLSESAEYSAHAFAARFRVKAGSAAAGRAVRDVLWPADSRVTRVERGAEHFVPDGNSVLLAGDVLTIEGEERTEGETCEALAETVGEKEGP